MQLQRRNFGLSGHSFKNIDSAYDNLLGIGKKGKAKKAYKSEKKETKRSQKLRSIERRGEKKDSRQDRRVLNNDKRQVKNDMRTAKVDQKKVQTEAMTAAIQAPDSGSSDPPTKKSNTKVYVAAGVGIILVAAGAFLVLKKPQSIAAQ